MNDPTSPDLQTNRMATTNDRVNFSDWLFALVRRRRLVIGLPLIVAICAAIATLAMPDIYKATTKILPRQPSESNVAAILNQLGSLAGGSAGALSIKVPIEPNFKIPIELYISMLKSRSIADDLVQRFDLKNVYGEERLEKAREVLARNSVIVAGKDGLITIEVEDRKASRAAQIANAYVDELFKLTKTLALTKISQRRVFFQRQMQTSKEKLTEAEAMLKHALDTRRVSDIDAKSRAMVEVVARLSAQISAKEAELGATQAFVTADNQDHNPDQQELARMRTEFAKLENSNSTVQGLASQYEKQDGFNSIKMLHDVKYYETLYKLLKKRYETACLEEAKDSSILEILDKATEPESNFKPKRLAIVLGSALLALVIMSFWVLFADVVQIGKRFGLLRQSWKGNCN